jgi:hypothetical protein
MAGLAIYLKPATPSLAVGDFGATTSTGQKPTGIDHDRYPETGFSPMFSLNERQIANALAED